MIVSEERMEKSLRYLAETDQEEANLKGEVARSEAKWKAKRDIVFRHLDGTVADRTAEANTHPDVLVALEEHHSAITNHAAVYNKRKTEMIIIDVWRSENASRRIGNIT